MGIRRFAAVAVLATLLATACAVPAHAALFDSDPFSSDEGGFTTLSEDATEYVPIVINQSGESIVLSDYVPPPATVTSGTSNPTSSTGGQLGITSPITTTTDLAVGGGNQRTRVAQTFEGPGTGAESAWRFLEEEAEQLIATQHQVAEGPEITDWARGQVRAWMLMRLIEIIKQPVAERTAEEQAAVAYLQTKVWDRRKAVGAAALDQFHDWQADPCTFDPPAPYTYSPGLTYCRPNSYEALLLGTPMPPSAAEFMDYGGAIASEQGLDRIVRELAKGQDIGLEQARPVVDTEFLRATRELRAGLDLLRVLGRGLVDGNTDMSGSGESPFHDETVAAMKTLFEEAAVNEAAGALFEFAILAAIERPSLPEMLVFEVIVLTKSIWDRIDLDTIDDKLEGAQTTVEQTPPDLAAMLDEEGGVGEIMAIFMEETLHDHLYERKQLLLDPPARAATDLSWERTTRADAAWESSEELAALPLTDWRKPLAQLPDPPVGPIGSAEILAAPRGHWFLITDPAGGMIISPNYGRIQVNSPEKTLSLGYTNWEGEHWTAWWVGSTFIHIKDGKPLSGSAQVVESLERRCPPTQITEDDGPTGPDCVKGTGTSFLSELAQGDTVLLGGQYRRVARVVNDQYFQVTKPFKDTTLSQPVVKVAGSRSTCWQTGECFESDEIHYVRSGQELKARLGGNRPPTLDPQVSGTAQTKTTWASDPISGLAQPVVQTGFRAGTDVTFDGRALDPDGDAVTVDWTFAPSTGTPCGDAQPLDCTVQGATAVFRWDAPGSYVVSAIATDPDGATATWSRTISILSATSGHAPVAGDDAVSTPEDTPIEFFVGGNDVDIDNDLNLASVSLADNPTHGTWEHLGNGRVRYTPDQNFVGNAEAGYRICDATSLCDDGAIVVKAISANDPPVAVDDTASTSRTVAKSVKPWLNDTDQEGGLVQGSIVRACVSEPSGCGGEDGDLHGTWTISSGLVRYTPAAGYTGPASYRYRICDIDGACDDATIRFEVIDNDPPIAAVDHATVLEDGGPITFDVLGNDSDPDGQILPGSVKMSTLTCEKYTGFEFLQCVGAVIGAAHGDWSSNGDGTITYTPTADYSNTGWIPAVAYYMVCDDDGACSEGKAQIDVTDVNDAPYFVFTGPDRTVDEDSGQSVFTTWARWAPGPVRFLTKAGDESQQSVDILVEAEDRSLFSEQPTIDAAGDLRFTPAPDAHGSTEVRVRLHDDGGTANGGVDTSEPVTFTITINEVNDPPVANDDAVTTDEDTPVTVDVLANDVEVDGDALSITSVSDPALGSATVESGKVRYVPYADRSGSDSFTYTICEPSGECSTATVEVTIDAINDPPVLAGDSSTQTVQYSDLIASVKFSASDRDDDAGDVALTPSSLPAGLAFVDNGDGTGTLSGAAGVKEGTYPVTVTATDPGGQTASATFTLVVVPEKASIRFAATDPAAVKVAAAGGNSGPVTLTVLVSETEPDAPNGSAAAGNINRAQTTVELVPVGPGTTIAGSCTAVPVSPVTGYADELTVKCSFSSLPVNTYTVSAKVADGWYVGSAENVFTVYDPSLGFTTGGGWFYWPGTTDRTNFGYVMKYTSKLTSLKGSLLVIRHRPDGSIYRVKSNALSTLSVGEDRSIPMGWASFTGKATYLEPGWLNPLGNHTFTVYVEDRNEPGTGTDRFWLKVDNDLVPVTLSMTGRGATNAVTLSGGNIVVPHQPARR